jgi:hypothetical protein
MRNGLLISTISAMLTMEWIIGSIPFSTRLIMPGDEIREVYLQCLHLIGLSSNRVYKFPIEE